MASLTRYNTGATIRTTIAITITTILRTATGTGVTTVIGTTGTTMMMIRPKDRRILDVMMDDVTDEQKFRNLVQRYVLKDFHSR